jgi:outer membrane immunogenic protein
MNMLRAGALVGSLVAGPAMAADMPLKAPPPPLPVYNWTGCYVAAGGGYGLFNQDRDIIAEVTDPAGAGTTLAYAVSAPAGAVLFPNQTEGGRGWLATAQFGCDYQFAGPFGGNWVIGAFVDGDWSDLRGDHGLFNDMFSGEQRLRSSWAVGGRIGWLVTPTLLTYFTGGYTQASFSEVDYTNNFTAAAFAAVNGGIAIAIASSGPPGLQLAAQRYDGFFVGGGAEYAIGWWPGLFWKTEYRFSDYRTQTVSINCVNAVLCGTAGPTGLAERIHPYVQTVRSELVWRFNWGGPVRAGY